MCMQSVVCLDLGRSAEIIPFRNGLIGQLVRACNRRVPDPRIAVSNLLNFPLIANWAFPKLD